MSSRSCTFSTCIRRRTLLKPNTMYSTYTKKRKLTVAADSDLCVSTDARLAEVVHVDAHSGCARESVSATDEFVVKAFFDTNLADAQLDTIGSCTLERFGTLLLLFREEV